MLSASACNTLLCLSRDASSMSLRWGKLSGPGFAPVQPPRTSILPAQSYGGSTRPTGPGSRGGRSGDGMDGSGLILGPGSGGLSPEFAEHLQKKKIIIPGAPSGPPSRGPAKVIIPDKEKNFAGILSDADTVTTPTAPGHYRPPAGFMNEELPEDECNSMDPSEMLNRLRTRAGRWYTLGRYIPALYKQNFDSTAIDEITGITPLQQNKWVVAATIYDSLKASGKVPDSVMAVFDSDGDDLLYPFRFLTSDMRVAAALYLVENKLNPTECDVLARSMKEWERRPSERSGFSDHPGDCLAFKYLRDALEMRSRKELVKKAEQGIKVAVTDGARARLNEILAEEGQGTSASGASAFPTTAANMLLLRLSEDEIGYRALPVIGEHDQIRAEDITSAPRSTQEGPFCVFSLNNSAAVRWVALPQWKAVSMARVPVAIEVPDCSQVQGILAGTKAKTDEDRKRLSGPGLFVVEGLPVKASDIRPDTFYLATVPSVGASLVPGMEKVELVPGDKLQAAGRAAIATLLFVCRPPIREALQAAAESNKMLSV